MSFFKEDYLRVLTPITTNGINPVMDNEGRIKYKESHLPLSAFKDLEKQNLTLPDHLKMKIERVQIFANPAPQNIPVPANGKKRGPYKRKPKEPQTS